MAHTLTRDGGPLELPPPHPGLSDYLDHLITNRSWPPGDQQLFGLHLRWATSCSNPCLSTTERMALANGVGSCFACTPVVPCSSEAEDETKTTRLRPRPWKFAKLRNFLHLARCAPAFVLPWGLHSTRLFGRASANSMLLQGRKLFVSVQTP